MKSTDIDWRSGNVTHWALDAIDESAPFRIQLEELREDLAQVSYANRVVIDVGWYPDFSPDGGFIVFVVQNEDWEHPLAKERCASFEALRASLDRAVQTATEAAAK